TLFIGELNLRNNTLQYINAGHFPPYLVQGGEITRLESGCTIIGAFETLPEIKMGEVRLTHAGTIFACTDGLTDVMNEFGAYFDDSRISDILERSDRYETADLLNDALMNEVDQFRDARMYPDDIALLTCKYTINLEQEDSES
ncbi:MAG: PP2C family protein-serine/threonine phosphatase, partial [Saprospiraceae bacterium]